MVWSNKITLSTSVSQKFSVPKPIIYYIFEGQNLKVSEKLIKSCKFFKLIHLRSNESRLSKLEIWHRHYEIQSGLLKFKGAVKCLPDEIRPYGLIVKSEMKKIKIMDCLILHDFQQQNFDNLIPKLDISATKKIQIWIYFHLSPTLLKYFLQPNVKELNLQISPSEYNMNLSFLAFERCPKLENLSYVNITIYFSDF